MKKEDGLSNFIKKAYEKGRVKDVSEAFEKYPVQEEWHQGKLELLLKEPKEIYSVYSIGDIVFVRNYQYEDGTIGTNHLFVIIDKNNIAVPMEYFGMIISSKIEKTRFKSNVLLKKNNENGLSRDSILKTDELYTIQNEQILFKIGSVDKSQIKMYKEMFNKM